ncbi:isopentenyl pyrophosphate isomerase [Staphylococcus gallinarum]|uniref:Isopentenyl pyrophosphate isomerase n=1 Tax=Staphylococcus gallinarum TaxID=1293 RepID=A0A380FMQ7_STAGA|nr:isopentenyl pyrophosphate isomerase [Staphylococcus gallinarum]
MSMFEIAMAQQDASISDFDEMRFVHHSIPKY